METMDVAVVRAFPIRELIRLDMRAEAFPNRFVNTPQFGSITEAATPGREIQLSLRASF